MCNSSGLHLPIDEFWGVMCGCTSALPPDNSPVRDHCGFLREMGIYYYQHLGFFVCTAHGFLLHPYHLISHLKSAHILKEVVGKTRLSQTGYDALVGHIQKSFQVQLKPLPDNEPGPLCPDDWSMIDVPVPGLPVVVGFKCGVCGTLSGTKESFQKHYSKEHGRTKSVAPGGMAKDSSSMSNCSKVLMQRCFMSQGYKPTLFSKGHNKWYFQVMEPQGGMAQFQLSESEAQITSSLPPPAHPAPTLPYISELGWINWLQRIESSEECITLKWLVSIPQRKHSKRQDDLEKIEYGLFQTSNLLRGYLLDAEGMLDSMAASVRDAIRGG